MNATLRESRSSLAMIRLRAVAALARFHLGELADDLPVPAVQIGGNRGALRLDTEPLFPCLPVLTL